MGRTIARKERRELEVDPVSGEELQRIVNEIVATPEPIAKRLAEIIAEGKEGKQ
jgi:hypothetical protein